MNATAAARALQIAPKAATPPSRQKQLVLDLNNQLIVDLFAGGGGVSVGMEMAWGRSPDIAVNHNEAAIAMHRMNHPQTRHFITDVFEIDPFFATMGRPVGWLHLSPDCRHFSQSSAGQPREAKIRGLSWVGKRWAAQVRPVCISLENVKQIQQWGPLIAKRDPKTGRVLQRTTLYWKTKRGVKATNTWRPAEKGERVPIQDQFLVPDPKRIGQTWRKFVRELEALGYHVESKLLVAANQGGHTTRERLLMMARCDGEPIVWPQASNFKKPKEGQIRWKPVHECLDFSIPCPSIFARKKTLAENTNKRLAKGITSFVLENADPFIVPIAHYNGQDHAHSTAEPLRTIKAATKGGEFALCAPSLIAATHHGGERVYGPMGSGPTVTGAHRGEIMLSAPSLVKFKGQSPGHSVTEGCPTITSGGNMARDAGAAHALGLVSPVMVQVGHGEGTPGIDQRRGDGTKSVQDPAGTIMTTGMHAVAAATLIGVGGPEYAGKPTNPEAPIGTLLPENHRGLATAFLTKYYSEGGQWSDAEAPMDAATTKARMSLATAYLMQAGGTSNTGVGRETDGAVPATNPTESQQHVVAAHLTTLRGTSDAHMLGDSVEDPCSAISAQGNHHGLVAATLVTNITNNSATDIRSEPAPTIQTGNHQYLATALMSSLYEDGSDRCRSLDDSAPTITASPRHAVVECTLSSHDIAGALRVADFLLQYGQGKRWDDARARRASLTVDEMLALVTVFVKGVAHVIVDIGLRMLVPRELYNAQDFPRDYIIDRGADGRKFTITEQVRMVGNSVDPLMVKDLFRLNAPHLAVRKVA